MFRSHFLRSWFLFVFLSASAFAQSAPIDHAKAIVGLHASVKASANYQLRVYAPNSGETDPLSSTTYTNQAGLTTAVMTPNVVVTLTPGQLYRVSVTSTSWASADFHFNAPPGYSVRLADSTQARTARTTYLLSAPSGGNGTTTFDVEIAPQDGAPLLHAGFSTMPSLGETLWAIGLGKTQAGRYVGVLRWRENAITSALLDPGSLVYADPVDGDVAVNRDSYGAISNITTWAVAIDIERDSGGSGYTIKARPPWDDSSPFREYHVYNPDTSWQGRVRIDVTSYDADQTRTDAWTLSDQSGVKKIEQANVLRRLKIVSTSGPGSGERTETVTLEDPTITNTSLQVIMKSSRLYRQFAWGREELVSDTSDPDGLALTTSYEYFSSSAGAGSYAKLKWISRPDGTWERYDYYDDTARWGQLSTVYKPWQDAAPTSPSSATTSNCAVTLLDYTGERSVFQEYVASSESRVMGTTIAKTVQSYSFGTVGTIISGQESPPGVGLSSTTPMRTETIQTYSASGTYLTTVRKVYHSSAPAAVAGRTISQTNPDGTKISYALYYHEGDGMLYESQLTGTATQVDTGSTQVSTCTLLNHSDVSFNIDPVWCVPNKSTQRESGRSYTGGQDFEKLAAWTGTGALYSAAMGYDSAGFLTYKTDTDKGEWAYTYASGQLKDQSRSNDNTSTTKTFDALMRISSTVETGVSAAGSYAAQSDITTTYTYDAANHLLSTTKSAGSLSLTTSSTYNLAGLLGTSTDERGLTTTFAYSDGGRTVTATLPNGGTKIETRYLDGSPKSTTGTAVVAEYRSITVNTDGTLAKETRNGVSTQTRWARVTTDWLGRATKEEHPTTSSSVTFTKQSYYNTLGQLSKTTEPGLADTLYTYDALGQVLLSGLDLNANGTLDLASADRITKTDRTVDVIDSATWKRVRTYVYADATASTASLKSDVQELADLTHAVRTYDAWGNLTVQSLAFLNNNPTTGQRLVQDTTDRPDSTTNEVVIARNGLVQSKQAADGLVTTFKYDALRRVTEQIDPRYGSSHPLKTAYYTNVSAAAGTYAIYASGAGVDGQVAWREDAAGNRTTYTYSASNGLLIAEINPLTQSTYYSYNKRGQVIRQWGPAAYPVEYAYNAYGEKIAMRTFRNPTQDFTGTSWPLSDSGSDASNPDPSYWSTGDKTTWTYDDATGLLLSKTDAASHSASYTYNTRGQLATRTWARGVVTTYSYDSLTAEQTSITYSDGTPGVYYAYTRLGQLDTVRDATSASSSDLRDFVYDSSYPLRQAAEAMTSFYDSRVLTQLADTSASSTTVPGRYRGFQLGASANSNSELEQTYTYTSSARFSTLASKRNSNATSRTFTYGYETNSALVKTLSTSDNSFYVTRSFESYRDVLTTLDTKWGSSASTSLAKYVYTSNELAQRDSLVQTGDAFSSYSGSDHAIHQTFAYNNRNELTGAPTYAGSTGTSSPLTNRQHEFNFDAIGNRNWAGVTGSSGDRKNYSSNSLNQYSSRDNSISPFSGTQSFTYDADGNVTDDGQWTYAWDAENRLVSMETKSSLIGAGVSSTDARRLEFTYDYIGRRVQKLVRNGWNGSTYATVLFQNRYLYDGWSLIAEYDVSQSTGTLSVKRSYTWGLDIARSLTDAGGVGALLQIADHASGKTYHPAYDGNGNIMALVNASTGAVAATYEYSPFGETISATVNDSTVSDQPFRFSTKFTDAETGFVYYGRRYYSPGQGRFFGRDPIEEKGGLHLYAFCLNDCVNKWDVLGNWPPPYHQDSLLQSMQQAGLSAEVIQLALASNSQVDTGPGAQDASASYTHFMSAPRDTQAQALTKIQDYANYLIETAQRANTYGNDYEFAETLGKLSHLLQDATSPSHVNQSTGEIKVWRGLDDVVGFVAGAGHVLGELVQTDPQALALQTATDFAVALATGKATLGDSGIAKLFEVIGDAEKKAGFNSAATNAYGVAGAFQKTLNAANNPRPVTGTDPNYGGIYISTTYYWGIRDGVWVPNDSSDNQVSGSDPASLLALIYTKSKNKQ